MTVDKDLLLLTMSLIITLLGFFMKTSKSEYDTKLAELKEKVKDLEHRVNALTYTQLTHAGELKSIVEALSRVEGGFKDQEIKREKFLESIQAQIASLVQKINDIALKK
jgi:hypothetical protein